MKKITVEDELRMTLKELKVGDVFRRYPKSRGNIYMKTDKTENRVGHVYVIYVDLETGALSQMYWGDFVYPVHIWIQVSK